HPPSLPPFPYTTLFRSLHISRLPIVVGAKPNTRHFRTRSPEDCFQLRTVAMGDKFSVRRQQFRQPTFLLRDALEIAEKFQVFSRSEEHTSELQSRVDLV